MNRYSKVWWAKQKYDDPLPRAVKRKRFVWIIIWGCFAKWLPYFFGKQWRNSLLRWFGMKADGWHTSFYPSVKIWAPWNIEIGNFVAIDDEVNLYSVAKITIGTKVAISREAFICTASHDISRPERPLVTAPIVIADGVWIGARAMILPGVRIGEGAIVAANAVVTKDVEPWTVVAGNPAKVIKQRALREEGAVS